MKKLILLPLLFVSHLALGAEPAPAGTPVDTNRGGTMKGAAVGGLGGAAVGHPVAGAVVGGMIGHHRRHKAEKAALKQQKAAAESQAAPDQAPTGH